MTPIIHLKCPACGNELEIPPSPEKRLSCPKCHTDSTLFMNDSIVSQNLVTACVSCGHDALYVQKDFNRQTGMAIVVIGIAASIYFFARSQPFAAMASLGMTALVDYLAYFLV